MRKFKLSIVLLLISLASHSQAKWHKGFIINLKNDTTHGLLANLNSKTNSWKCEFKMNDTSDVIILSPSDILEYNYMENKAFVSKEVKIDSITKKVFLEYLVKGKVNLYHYREKDDYYFAEKDGTLIELKNTIEELRKDGEFGVVEHKEYINLLNYILADANMQSEILDANFTTKDLVSLAKNYHYKVCNNEDCIIYKKSLVKPKTHFGFHIAGNINKFRYNDNLTTENIVSPSFGARFEMEKIVEWNQNISFVADINFYYLSKTTITPNDKAYGEFPVKYNGDTHVLSKNPVSTDTEDKLDVNLETIIISIPVSINYNFIQESGSLYFGFGFDNMFTQSKADLEISRANTATEYAKPLPKWIISPLCKAGYKYQTPNNNYIYCEIQFEKSVPMTPSLSASDYPTNTQTSLKLGFEF